MDESVTLVLAPVDGSDASAESVEYAVAIADRYEADLHLLHVLDEQVARGLETGDVDAQAVAADHREFTNWVRDLLDERSHDSDLDHSAASGFSSRSLSRSPGSVILDTSEELGAEFIVMPRETPSASPDKTLGKASLYVLEYASQPVLSV
jgi:nucleotide-binding universal stress UspA family protein